MSKIRKTIAANMLRSATTIPHLTNFDDADITELEGLRKESAESYADGGIKLTSLAFVLKAVALALKQHPTLNASIDMERGEIIYKHYVNLGVAVDTERGLIVPVLRDVDKMSIPQIAQGIAALAEKVRRGSKRSTICAVARLPSAIWAQSAGNTRRRLSIIPKWPFCWPGVRAKWRW